jgi:hypothetical protein
VSEFFFNEISEGKAADCEQGQHSHDVTQGDEGRYPDLLVNQIKTYSDLERRKQYRGDGV